MNKELERKLIEIRQLLHKNPELGFCEFETSKLIRNHMDKLKISYETLALTGTLATLRKGEGPTVILRADMDALPIAEDTGLRFTSSKLDIMHACGHDIHTTMLIGAAYQLKDIEFAGTIKFLFQPSEEGNLRSPQVGKSGGQIIAESGVIEGAKTVIGLHVDPSMDVGTIGFKGGEALANVCNFIITVKGKSGHAGALEHVTDPVLISSQLIVSAQSIISHTAPARPAVLAFTSTEILGVPAYNIVPETVILKGSLRVLNLEIYNIIIKKLKLLMAGMEVSYDCQINMELTAYYPSLLNDPKIHQLLVPVHEAVFGKGVLPQEGQLIAEDFAFYSRKVPSVFYFLGARAKNRETYYLHHPKVEFNEDCIAFGVQFFCEAALKILK